MAIIVDSISSYRYRKGRATVVAMFARNTLCAVALPRVGLTTANLLDRLLDPGVTLGTSTPKSDPAGDYTWAMLRLADKLKQRVTGYLVQGKAEGARPVVGGERLTEGELGKGYFVPPTIFADVSDDMRIAREEIFGPVISALPYTDLDEIARRANATNFGLGSGVWTRDVSKAHRLAKAIHAGSVWVNCSQVMDPAVPFGG